MTLAREAIDLLLQAANSWQFDGTRHGLRDREWMALRFLARANRFSRTPSALAEFVGLTRGTASQMVKRLEGKGYLERRRSAEDQRSVTLHVTPRGEKFLSRDPINALVNAVGALDTGGTNLRGILRHVLDRLGTTQHRHHADICRECMFLAKNRTKATAKAEAEFTCRFFRATIKTEEIDLLCFNFERRGAATS
jgi:MarR family transcriptional repressor of emrRAB